MKKSKELAIQLEYQKLLAEYNAILIAMTSIILGIAIFSYTISKDFILSLISAIFALIFINEKRKEASNKLDNKIKETKFIY